MLHKAGTICISTLVLVTVWWMTIKSNQCHHEHAVMSVEIRPGVLLQMGELAKTFLTVGAAVRFDAQVYAQVLGQV